MKFSVLLPTRNRLEYLRYAVTTVLRQDFDDWEIVISDNFSEDDIAGYAQSLNDPRIKYFRTESFVPVTDNWNNALYHSSGDYVIMLGDDDCLMQSYFSTLNRLIEEYHDPEAIYTSAYIYAYPGVMPDAPQGYLQPYGYAVFFNESPAPAWLDRTMAMDLVSHSMNFKVRFGYNMQFSLIKRTFIDSLQSRGPFFQSPYPDFFASNVMLLKAERILICPLPLVTIGITPKSFGYYFNNHSEKAGDAFLNHAPDPQSMQALQRTILPGTTVNTCWLIAMETIKVRYGGEFPLRVNYFRYRLLQIANVHKNYFINHNVTSAQLREQQRQLRLWERILLSGGLSAAFTVVGLIPTQSRVRLIDWLRRLMGQCPENKAPASEEHYNTIMDVFERVNPLHE